MENYDLQNDLKVFGVQVTTFPKGISQTFNALVKKVGGFDRPFYGISYIKDGLMVYLATTLEKHEGEAKKYQCQRYTIERGEYLATTVLNWRERTDSIKDVFLEMLKDNRVDKAKPAIEWYKDDNEMVCMVKSIVNKS